jgi:hypothetical protein
MNKSQALITLDELKIQLAIGSLTPEDLLSMVANYINPLSPEIFEYLITYDEYKDYDYVNAEYWKIDVLWWIAKNPYTPISVLKKLKEIINYPVVIVAIQHNLARRKQ